MKLSKEAIAEYQELYFAEFGERLSEKKAREQAYKILTLLKFIFNKNENESISITKK